MKQNKLLKKLNLKMPYGYSLSIHLSAIVLNLFGFFMIISASMNRGVNTKTLSFTAGKELVFLLVSYYLMVLFAKNFKMSFFKKHFKTILLITIVALLATLFSEEVNGAQAWIRFKSITIQPSEFAKVFMILTTALYLGDRKEIQSKAWYEYILAPTLILLLIVFIIAKLQSDFGSAVVLLAVTFVCYLIPSNPKIKKMQGWMTGLFVVGLILLALLSNPLVLEMISKLPIPPYMVSRFVSSADPLHDKGGDSWQIYNGLVAFIQGGFFGKGFAQSINKYGYIPEAHTDFILAIIVEELGMIGFLVIFVGYSLIIFNMMKYALRVKTEQDKIILIGITSYLVIHFIFNVGGITALIPLTGVPLLLISAGGSSRMAVMIAIGIAQATISKYNQAEKRRSMQ